MKKILITLFTVCFLGLSSPIQAVEWVMDMTDGSSIFSCEIKGVAYRVSVKPRRDNVYSVFSRGKGTTNVAGPIKASSIEDAARIACGEK